MKRPASSPFSSLFVLSRRPWRPLVLALAVSLALPPVALPALAAGLPDLGDEAQIEVSPLLEKKAGESVLNDIRLNDPSYLDDTEVSNYLDTLGNRLAAASSEPGYGFVFFAMRDPQINAFATYGGFIGVNSGLIVAARSESELAGVLAHEISHVTQHHLARGVAKQRVTSVAMMAAMAMALLAARSNSQAPTAAVMSAQAASVQSQLAYTRDFEREADRFGFEVLRKSGFDAHGMADFFKRLQQETRLYENNAPAYLRTHPLNTERISDMENRAAEVPYKQVVDSLDFQLVRAKLQAEVGTPKDAVTTFETLLREKKFAAEPATRYGYARALLRNKQLVAAEQELKTLRGYKLPSAMIDKLAADLAMARKDYPAAEKIYRDAGKAWPFSQALRYGLLETLIEAGKLAPAMTLVDADLQDYPQDYKLYGYQARIAAGLGKNFLQHRAQAEVYALQGRTQAAVEQLQLAQKGGDANFYELSAADARLRELKARLAEEQKDRGRQ